MNLNSLLHIEKTTGDFHCSGSFATILFNSIERDEDISFIKIERHPSKKFTDVLTVQVNGKMRKTSVTGRDSVVKIFKRLKK